MLCYNGFVKTILYWGNKWKKYLKLYLNYFLESVDEGDRHTEIEKYDDGNDYVFIADLLEKLDDNGATINYKCTYNEVAEDLEDEDKSNLKRVFSFK